MSDRAFVDSNVLVYAHDRGAGAKREQAVALLERLWQQRSGVLSTQVIQEFYVNVRRKAANPVPLREARKLVNDYLVWETVVNDGRAILGALEIEDRYRISFWDSLIVQAANTAGVDTLYSEDLSHGQKYGMVEVINPFLN
ncbi:MAG: PIN domain-containing protein [bacterium]|nr:PIN domain-containing protein [bacterium]